MVTLFVALTGGLAAGCSGSSSSSSATSTSSAPVTTGATDTSRSASAAAPSATGTSAGPATTGPPTTAPQVGPPSNLVELRGDGLGVVTFGDGAEPTLAALTSIYGAPSVDSGYQAEAAGRVRRASFGPLMVTFAGDPGAETFTGWSYTPEPASAGVMRTSGGAAVGMTFADLASQVGPTRSEPVGAVHVQCWTEASGEICATSSSRFAGPTPDAQDLVSALEAGQR